MGRYYNGDIEGKFWFGVQSSNDADFFGVEGTAYSVEYYYSEDDKKDVHDGLVTCDRHLSGYKKALDKFFDEHESYNDEQLVKYLNENVKGLTTKEKARELLQWYARLHLGRKIYNCIKENGECSFSAEL